MQMCVNVCFDVSKALLLTVNVNLIGIAGYSIWVLLLDSLKQCSELKSLKTSIFVIALLQNSSQWKAQG